jgi:hypothetical protein
MQMEVAQAQAEAERAKEKAALAEKEAYEQAAKQQVVYVQARYV